MFITVGRPFLSEFFSGPYPTATDRLSFYKIPQNQRKMPFFIKTFGVFNNNSSGSAKRTVT
jgi:hypothetical protein